jgi:hypothetical protein
MKKRTALKTDATRWKGHIEVVVYEQAPTHGRFFSAWLTKGEARRLRDQLGDALVKRHAEP